MSLLQSVSALDTNSIVSEELYNELFEIADEIERQRKYYELEARATQLRCAGQFKKLYSLYLKRAKKDKQVICAGNPDSYSIDYTEKDLSFDSGIWQADESGIFTVTDQGKQYACTHPIAPVGVLRNVADETCKTQLTWKVRGRWTDIAIPREILASANKIVALAQYGVQVTSESSKLLVKYLADIEAQNPGLIMEHTSTSRLGWIGKEFMPYTSSNIIFDSDPKLMSLFRSVHTEGDRETWYNLAKKVRKEGHIEVLLYMASSLASVLVEPCGTLPFIVSLWGGTGLGKTVALMIATSIWADPSEGQYMSDAKSTATAMEIRLDALNSLPLMVDDLAQVKVLDDDFSNLIYRLCAGKGRDRSNQSLGLNALTNWRNCTLTNGERSLTADLSQGGASNRVIDVEIQTAMFKNGNATSKALRGNYGFCGKEFIELICSLGFEEINKRFVKWVDKLKQISKDKGEEKEDKQINPMALILTADELSDEYLYCDGVRLDTMRCWGYLRGKNDISENTKAYEYLTDIIAENRNKFMPDENGDYRFGMWGAYLDQEHTQIAIIPSRLKEILKDGNFQEKTFLSWLERKNLIEKGDGAHKKKKIKILGDWVRCYVIRTDYDPNEDKNAKSGNEISQSGNDDEFEDIENIPFD